MTAFTVSDDATGGSGGLSANAMALAADTNLVFSMRAAGMPTSSATLSAGYFTADGILAVNRKFKLTKAAAAIEAKVATSHLSMNASSSIDGSLRVIRGSNVIANLPFTVPPAGQIPAPNVTASLAPNASSTLTRDVAKIKKFKASRKDALGQTTVGGEAAIWLGKGATRLSAPYAELKYDETGNWGNQLTTGPNAEISVVAYDQLADKEGEPVIMRLSWPLGPFNRAGTDQTLYSISGTSGNLPEGTVVNFLPVYQMPDSSYILAGVTQSFTITSAGGLSYNPSGSIHSLECPAGPYGMPSKINAPLIWLFKLSTHTRWNAAPWGNATNTIANTFSEGSINTPGSNFSFSAINNVNVYFNISGGPIDGTNVAANGRVQFKVFSDMKQVAGPGTVYTAGAGNKACYWGVDADPANDNLSFSSLKIDVHYDDYQNGWPAYGAATLLGDSYYVANQPIGLTINIPSRPNVTGLDIYVQEFTTVNGYATVENNVPYKLIYSGPYVAAFEWTGTVLNPSVTIPAANTTDNYPAVYTGNMGWDAADPAEIVVLEGDQVVCELTAGSLNVKSLVQLSMPIEFID